MALVHNLVSKQCQQDNPSNLLHHFVNLIENNTTGARVGRERQHRRRGTFDGLVPVGPVRLVDTTSLRRPVNGTSGCRRSFSIWGIKQAHHPRRRSRIRAGSDVVLQRYSHQLAWGSWLDINSGDQRH